MKYKNTIITLCILIIIIFIGYFLFENFKNLNKKESEIIANDIKSFSDPTNGTYLIEDHNITLVNGVNEETISDSVSKIITRIFGKEIEGDLNNDSKLDKIFFLSQETGGTGIFFYVVAAENIGVGKYLGTKAVFLGDRIAPQNINIDDGVALVNYAIRDESDPMTQDPSVGVTKYVHIVNSELIEVIGNNK